MRKVIAGNTCISQDREEKPAFWQHLISVSFVWPKDLISNGSRQSIFIWALPDMVPRNVKESRNIFSFTRTEMSMWLAGPLSGHAGVGRVENPSSPLNPGRRVAVWSLSSRAGAFIGEWCMEVYLINSSRILDYNSWAKSGDLSCRELLLQRIGQEGQLPDWYEDDQTNDITTGSNANKTAK